MAHYLKCPTLWHLVQTRVSHDLPSDTITRVGLHLPETIHMLTLASVFHGYHAIRNTFTRKPEFLFQHLNLEEVHSAFAAAFEVAARAAGLACHSDVAH